MKISIGAKIIDGPYGGGNEFFKNLIEFLKSKNHIVIDHLNDDDIDLIVLTNPLKSSTTSTFNHLDILNYQRNINPNSISIQRVNECDERKNTNYVNKKIINSNKNIDVTLFVSDWLKNLYLKQGIKTNNIFVIKGGPSSKVYNQTGKLQWDKTSKLKIITHHWSDNWSKGFDSYEKLDQLVNEKKWKGKIEFTYIGNLPKNFKFKNTNVISPVGKKDLSKVLKNHHLYITGSLNEPSGNHHMEGVMSGLPVLYINSGGIPEYCNEYGVMYELENLEQKLYEIINNYEELFNKTKNYKYSFENAALEFSNLLKFIQKNKTSLIANRSIKDGIYQDLKYLTFRIATSIYLKIRKIKKYLGKIKKKFQSKNEK